MKNRNMVFGIMSAIGIALAVLAIGISSIAASPTVIDSCDITGDVLADAMHYYHRTTEYCMNGRSFLEFTPSEIAMLTHLDIEPGLFYSNTLFVEATDMSDVFDLEILDETYPREHFQGQLYKINMHANDGLVVFAYLLIFGDSDNLERDPHWRAFVVHIR